MFNQKNPLMILFFLFPINRHPAYEQRCFHCTVPLWRQPPPKFLKRNFSDCSEECSHRISFLPSLTIHASTPCLFHKPSFSVKMAFLLVSFACTQCYTCSACSFGFLFDISDEEKKGPTHDFPSFVMRGLFFSSLHSYKNRVYCLFWSAVMQTLPDYPAMSVHLFSVRVYPEQ